jgi:thymidylate synthase (FAD)
MRMKILDHGYLEIIEHWGSDERIIEAARMSTGKGFLGWGLKPCDGGCVLHDGGIYMIARSQSEVSKFGTMCTSYIRCDKCGGTGQMLGDEKLLRYLWENRHATPFEMAGMTIEVQAPIMVFREWHRHRVPFGYNEMSARYTPLPDVNYIPTLERLMIGSDGKNRQAGTVKDSRPLTEQYARDFQHALRSMYESQEMLYQEALAAGIPKELARIHLPVGRYSRMRATSNLRGWLSFLALRMAPGAQYEIRMYANAVGDLVKELFPRTWELFLSSK